MLKGGGTNETEQKTTDSYLDSDIINFSSDSSRCSYSAY